jgi:hypothetical protein
MIIEMYKNSDDIWVYRDNTQAELHLIVMVLTGWEIASFDDWINTDSHWEDTQFDGKKLRNVLIELRHQLTQTFLKYYDDDYVLQLEAGRLFTAAKGTTFYIAGYQIALKDKNRGDKARASAKLPRPKTKSQFKVAVSKIMFREKVSSDNFKTFMQMWQLGHIDGMTIKAALDRDRYIITDETGDLGARTYSWTTLAKMYSQFD